MAVEVTIINDVIEFVQKNSAISIILAMSTLALVVITALGLWRTNKHTVVSNNLIREEMKNRLRPWIKVGLMRASTITLNDNHVTNWDHTRILSSESRKQVKHVTMVVPIENVGNLPTKTRFHTVLFQKEEFNKIELRNSKNRIEKDTLTPIDYCPFCGEKIEYISVE